MTFIAALLLAPLLGAQGGPAAPKLQAARDLRQRGAAAEASSAYEALLPEIRSSGDRTLLAQVLLETGRSELAAGDYAKALQSGEEAATLFRAQHDLPNEASASNLTGSAQLYSGHYDAALDHYRHALDLDRRQHDVQGEINRLNNIANAYFFQGRYLDALANYETGLKRAEENAREPWAAGRRQLELTNLAILYEQLGQNQKALEYYKRALAGPSALSPAEHGQLLSNVGSLYRRLGDAVKALDTYREAQRLLEQQHLSDAEIRVLQNVGIALALDLHDSRGAAQAFTEALTKAEATGNRPEIVDGHLFRGEASVRAGDWKTAAADFAAALEGARATGATEAAWTALYGVARVQRQEGRPREALETLRAAIAKIESVRAGLGASSLKADFLANKRDVYDAAIALMLDSGNRDPEALFGMFEQARARNLRDAIAGTAGPPSLRQAQARLGAGSTLMEYWTGSDRAAVIAVTRDGATVFETGMGDALLKDVPAGTHQLLIVPDGALYRIAFEALKLKSGRLAIEDMTVSYLPSAALLLREPGRDTPMMPWQRQLLALGDPQVDGSSALPGDQRWARLPQAAREVASIAGALSGRAEIHTGADDRKRYLSSAAPLLHLATHAVADTIDANRSRILFSGGEYLFRGEVASLPLAGTELVTLSACDTEAGAMSRGEGVQSFSRAFLAAGARATVTTLWKVEDRATADFMHIFYEHLARGEAKAEALRSAKLNFLHQGGERSQPLYWAAFVLNGDGQDPIRPVLSWWWIVAVALVAATACRYLYSRRLHRLHLHPKL